MINIDLVRNFYIDRDRHYPYKNYYFKGIEISHTTYAGHLYDKTKCENLISNVMLNFLINYNPLESNKKVLYFGRGLCTHATH
jgi:hypothetical protein